MWLLTALQYILYSFAMKLVHDRYLIVVLEKLKMQNVSNSTHHRFSFLADV